MTPTQKYGKTNRAQLFIKSDEGKAAYSELLRMVDDTDYNTTASFSPAAINGNLLFVDKHMNYLCSHLDVKSEQYLSNLRLITKLR